jgi:hypothetical protein
MLAAILVVSPVSVVANVSPSPKILFRLAKTISICCLTPRRRSARSVHQQDSDLGQGALLQLALVGEVPENPAGALVAQVRLSQQFGGQRDFHDVGRCQLVRDRDPVGSALEMELHVVDSTGIPAYPSRAIEACGLLHLPRMQYGQQRRVADQGLGTADKLG